MSLRGQGKAALLSRAAHPVEVEDWAAFFKAFADGTRLAILNLLASRPDEVWTSGQIAEQLDIHTTTNIYHHMRWLEGAELLSVHHTREIRGIIEKHYWAGEFLRHRYGPMLAAIGRKRWEG